MTRISSRDNPRLREVLRLLRSARDRKKLDRFVLEGEHLVMAYMERYGSPETLIASVSSAVHPRLPLTANVGTSDTLVLPDSLFAELFNLPTDNGVLAVIVPPCPESKSPADFCVLLEDVQDPGNMGSILRSTAGAGVRQVYVSAGSAVAWSPKVLRSAQGSHFLLDIYEDTDLAAWTQAYDGLVVASVVSGGKSIYETDLTGKIALAIGNEGTGLSKELLSLATHRVTIPMPGATESLNAAAAAAVCLFECVRQRSHRTPFSLREKGRG